MIKYSYFILICISTLCDIVLLLLSLKHRDKKAVTSFSMFAVLVIIAHVFYGASLIITVPGVKYFVHELKFFGVAFFSVAFYVMYMQFFDKRNLQKKRYVTLISLFPAISVILAVTNNYHHLFRAKLYTVENAYGSFVGVENGPVFWPYTIYSYLLFFFVLCIVIKAYFQTPKLYRTQLRIMVAAAVATMLINFVSVSGVLFEDFGDATLISFTIAANIQFYGLIQYKPARMIRMARGFAINEIKSPMVAFDNKNIFLDANLSAYRFFDLREGITRAELLSGQLGLEDTKSDVSESTIERNGKWLSVKIKKIYDEDEAFAVSVVLISDVTEVKQRERELENTASFDFLTGIPNRHSFLCELKKIQDRDLPVAIVHFNIRGMKAINRLQGNEAGDAVIKRVADALANAGESSFCARIGGDEFALILRNTAEKDALDVAASIEAGLEGIELVRGLSVKQSNLDNVNIINKQAMDNMYMNKLIIHSNTISGRGE